MCAIKTVKKPSDSLIPMNLPIKTNKSIKEIPVTISAFIIGILVTDITRLCEIFLRSDKIPTLAAVPIIVDKIADKTAIIRVCSKACSIVGLEDNSIYQSSEKPSKTQTLPEELKEKITITAIGA